MKAILYCIYIAVPYYIRKKLVCEIETVEKSKNGKNLRAMERPGLWNGAMANWNTILVAVPASTFSPVKTLTDLLKDAHQAK